MFEKIKIRPVLILCLIVLLAISLVAMYTGFENIALASTVGIVGIVTKLVESEEVGSK